MGSPSLKKKVTDLKGDGMALYMLIGLPGSGKSTVAAELDADVILSSDEIREELFGDAALQYDEDLLRKARGVEDIARRLGNRKVFTELYHRMHEHLSWDRDVVFDATNLTRKARHQAMLIAEENYNRDVVACVVRTPLEECLRRNFSRKRVVPEEVIRSMNDSFEEPTIEEGFAEIRSY